MTKRSDKSLDLGKLRGDERDGGDVVRSCTYGGSRPPPLLPEQFAERLEEKRFTNGKDDKPLVAGLYKQAFEEEFGKAEALGYNNLGWGDAEAIQISELLASGAAPKLKVLLLAYNPIGDEGVKALAEAIAGGAAPALEVRAKQPPSLAFTPRLGARLPLPRRVAPPPPHADAEPRRHQGLPGRKGRHQGRGRRAVDHMLRVKRAPTTTRLPRRERTLAGRRLRR